MFGLGITEIVIILVVLVIVFFGAKKLGGLAKSAGRVGGEFKKGRLEVEKEIQEMKNESVSNGNVDGSNEINS